MNEFPPIPEIESVLPHRGGMRLLDRVLDYDADNLVAELQVPDDGPFHGRGGVPAHVGIEYMAQAVACWAGCMARRRGQPPPLGFLLGTRLYTAAVPVFTSGLSLCVEVHREIMGDNGLGVFACRILSDGQVLATANVSVFEPPDAAAYLEQEG